MAQQRWNLPSHVADATRDLAQAQARIADLCVQIQQIPAPTGQETERAAWVMAAMRRLGLADVDQDEYEQQACREWRSLAESRRSNLLGKPPGSDGQNGLRTH